MGVRAPHPAVWSGADGAGARPAAATAAAPRPGLCVFSIHRGPWVGLSVSGGLRSACLELCALSNFVLIPRARLGAGADGEAVEASTAPG